MFPALSNFRYSTVYVMKGLGMRLVSEGENIFMFHNNYFSSMFNLLHVLTPLEVRSEISLLRERSFVLEGLCMYSANLRMIY